MKKSKIFIISGPSGAGEDSIIEGLKKYFDLERIITTTTRKMRPCESQGNPYYFIDKENFLKGINNETFAEYAEEYNSNLYGVQKTELERVISSGKIGIWKIEYKGVISARKNYPQIISILIMVSDLKILEQRIRRRDNVSEEYIKERTDYTSEWMKHTEIYDYAVYNEEGKLEEAIENVANIIKRNI